MSQGYQPFPSRPQFSAPTYAPVPLSDDQLRQLPPPPPPVGAARPPVVERPAGIALGATLAVTAGLQWCCGLALVWLTTVAGVAEFDRAGEQGALFHMLNRFNYRMLDGLAWPLFGFPLVSVVTGFLVLRARPWTRLVHSALGLVALAWSGWWLRDHLVWWAVVALYIALAVGVLWTPTASRWYGRQRS